MYHKIFILVFSILFTPLFAEDTMIKQEIKQLQQQAINLQNQIENLQKRLVNQSASPKEYQHDSKAAQQQAKKNTNEDVLSMPKPRNEANKESTRFHSSSLSIHTPNTHPESVGFYPTALMADEKIVTYIAGTPVVSSPYLGDRPAFDGSDYIVNISSINRDIRLMQQRRRLYEAYHKLGYPVPHRPIISVSGKTEPKAMANQPYFGKVTGDLTLGSSELDIAAALNSNVEAFMSIAYDESPPPVGGQRLANSSFDLNLGFVNLGNLDKTPFYFTAGQLYAPFGRYASAMISSPITTTLTRTKTRPFILGYKSQAEKGPYAAIYGFKSDTTLGRSAIGGINLGYTFTAFNSSGEFGGGYISSIADSQGMQKTGSAAQTTFGGFSSVTNGNEAISKVPGINLHGNLSFDRYNLTAEWVGATHAFRTQDLSYNGHGAKPQAAQLEAGVTFKIFDRPASFAAGYQWSKETLALNLPEQRINGVFNISVWKDTVESLEYRHDIDFEAGQFANGAAASGSVNQTTFGSGHVSDSIVAQIGVFF